LPGKTSPRPHHHHLPHHLHSRSLSYPMGLTSGRCPSLGAPHAAHYPVRTLLHACVRAQLALFTHRLPRSPTPLLHTACHLPAHTAPGLGRDHLAPFALTMAHTTPDFLLHGWTDMNLFTFPLSTTPAPTTGIENGQTRLCGGRWRAGLDTANPALLSPKHRAHNLLRRFMPRFLALMLNKLCRRPHAFTANLPHTCALPPPPCLSSHVRTLRYLAPALCFISHRAARGYHPAHPVPLVAGSACCLTGTPPPCDTTDV